MADRDYFQRVFKTLDFAIGTFQAGDEARKPSLVLGHPVFSEKGRLARILYATLDLAASHEAAAKAPLPQGGVLQVFDRRGAVLASYPESALTVGQSVANSALVSNIIIRLEGTLEMPGLDNVPRLYAFLPLRNGPDAGVFVSVGIPTALAFAEPKRILLRNLSILGVIALLVFFGAHLYSDRYILRPVNAILRAVRQMGMLIDDLLAFSQMGRSEMRQMRVNMEELVAEVVRELARDTESRKVEWKIGPLPEATVDRAMLKQVWVNLLSNAVK